MSNGSVSLFRPSGTAGVSVGSTSSNATLTGGGDTVVVTNTTAALAYVRFGSDSNVIASASDMPILPASKLILAVNSLITHAAAVSPAGSGTILFSRGDGSIV